MRVIGGNLKGKKILMPVDKNTRPLRDLVRESIFNLLVHSKKIKFEIQNSKVLDLFSGSGSFGLECISRGANSVTFFENYDKAIKVLKTNIDNLNVTSNTKIIEKNCFDYFETLANFEFRYDLIFLDPPYKERKINFLIDNIYKKKILQKDGVLIIHRHKKDDIKISDTLKILDDRNYGISKIIFEFYHFIGLDRLNELIHKSFSRNKCYFFILF